MGKQLIVRENDDKEGFVKHEANADLQVKQEVKIENFGYFPKVEKEEPEEGRWTEEEVEEEEESEESSSSSEEEEEEDPTIIRREPGFTIYNTQAQPRRRIKIRGKTKFPPYLKLKPGQTVDLENIPANMPLYKHHSCKTSKIIFPPSEAELAEIL